MELTGELATNLLDAAPDPVVIVDGSGCIVFANAQVEAVFGYAPQALIGEPVEILMPERFRSIHPASRAAFFERAQPRPMGIGLELFGRRKNGEEFPVEISLSPLQTDAGLLVSSAIRDITRRKAIEREAIDARNEADRANRAKSAFLAAASHDLRQPLQTLTLLNAALGKLADPGSKTAGIAATSAAALGSMSELLNSLLDISKLEAGAVKPDIEDCSVKAIFASLREQFAAQAEAKGLDLVVDDCDDTVRTDPTLLEQIVQNLVANAIRYTQRGLVQLRCLHETAFVDIQVLDTGIGIATNELESIFDEFYQAQREPGQRREGLGLGLSIVRRVSQLLEHPLVVKSQPGEGSCFSVRVPRSRAPGAAASNAAADGADTTGGTVLIIDDDPAVADATAMFLDIVGFDAIVAAGADEACMLLAERKCRPDVIVCDFHLADGASGVGAIACVRETLQQSIPAVLITGDTSAAAADLSARIERCELLSKPVETDALVESIRRVLV